MAKLSIIKGTASKLAQIFVQDSSVTTGAGLTGLTSGSSGLTAYYYREGAASAVAISLTSMTLGTWVSGGFIVVNGTHMPGLYQIGIPDAALASGAKSVVILLNGATNMVPIALEIELTAIDNQDSVRAGLTSLPNASAASSGGLPTSGSGSNQIALDSIGAVTLISSQVPALDGSGRVTLTPGQLQIKKNTALNNFQFLMISSVDHITPKTGASVSAQRSIDGGALANCSNSPVELSSGLYVINISASDLNGTMISFKFTATGADPRYVTLITQA